MVKLMVGRHRAAEITAEVARRIDTLRQRTGQVPRLATVVVGDSPSSATYVKMKQRQCARLGIDTRVLHHPATLRTDELVASIRGLAEDSEVHGILIQHPVPAPIDKRQAFEAIPPEKDVDAVCSATLGRVILGLPALASCTPAGIMDLLEAYGVSLKGKRAIVLGRSPILGRPMASMLINAHATVTLCHSHTQDLDKIVREADLLIAAVGRPRFVRGEWIKPGAVIVDAGYNPGNVGDVHFDEAVHRAAMITPVPGGVGPMTIATLMRQTTDAAARQLGQEDLCVPYSSPGPSSARR